jgi:hypothetical protein
MTGYGRGYYGDSQLAPRRSRSGSGWFTIAVVVGLGAVIWFMLPGIGPKSKQEEEPTPAPAAPLSHDEELDQLARSSGFSSTKTYEDSVVANARVLKANGGRVELGPHLQHLEPRLEQ